MCSLSCSITERRIVGTDNRRSLAFANLLCPALGLVLINVGFGWPNCFVCPLCADIWKVGFCVVTLIEDSLLRLFVEWA